MELGENSASTEEPKEPKKDVETVKIRFCVFFDGTLNNRTNIDQRLVSASDDKLTDEERKLAADLKKNMTLEDLQKAKGIYKKFEGVGSYENGYTNIAKMERHIHTDTPPANYQAMLKSYIEGPGTRDKKSDKMLGYAIGTGISGVKNKVEKGVLDVVKKVSAKHFDKTVVIEKLTLDSFGFSRGAAAARSFIHEALLAGESVEQQLKDKGYQVGKVEVCFAGLYDTVSSHGLKFSDDTAALNLNAVNHAQKTIHLAAADEHRENFSLTTIKSAEGKGKEIYLPGVHSDVGGSYRDGAKEEQDVFWIMGARAPEEAEKHRQELIAAGWYTQDELTLKQSRYERDEGGETLKEVNLHGTRISIRNHYSRIPLHVMARFARENGVVFTGHLDRNEMVPPELNQVKQKIEAYINNASSSKPTDWHQNEPWLCQLRHDYFHFSARLEIGNGPRFIDGKRKRMTYDG